MENKIIFTAGQRRIYKEGEERIRFKQLPYTPAKVIEDLPSLEIHPKFKNYNYLVLHDKTELIPGVTAEMVDWWWANMEKGYHLWAPGEHYGFDWVVPPCEVGYEGSAEASYEFDAVHPIIITRQNIEKTYMFTDCMEHLWLSRFDYNPGEIYLVHMYEEHPEGLYWRTLNVMTQEWYDKIGNVFDSLPEFKSHMKYEAGKLSEILPPLYELWKNHPDPWQNVHYNLTVQKNEDGTYSHVYPNKAPSIEDCDPATLL